MRKIIKKRYIFIVLGILFILCCIFSNKISKVYEKNVQHEEVIEPEIYDDFTIKIDDINKLINNEIHGYVYIGRDTCPICLYYNKYLKNEYDKNNELIIYKFDTDFWRDNENFQSVLDKYNISSVPSLIKIDSDGSIKTFEFEGEDEPEDKIQMAFNKFLYE